MKNQSPKSKDSLAQEPDVNYKTGYIKLYRSIKNHWLWKENRKKTPFEAWVDLMIRACHSDLKEPVGVDFIQVKRGQVLTSQLQLSKEWMWSRKMVTRFLKSLEKDGMIAVECTTKWSMITICNYDSYQGFGTTKEQQKNNRGTTEEQQVPTYNNDSNYNNELIKEGAAPFADDELNKVWRDWIKYRRQKKESLTQVGAERQVNKLKTFSPEIAAEIINKSIECGWTGLFYDKYEVKTVPVIPMAKDEKWRNCL